MSVLMIEIETKQMAILEEKAKAMNLTVEQYAVYQLKRLTQSREERFNEISQYLLAKNHELYKRLA